ncbi:MAG: alpha/beta hydrolase [Verrucomicrobia bacterium]|nr:alpha/beta hydrolase [Verrucomicrobiota bacterium]
MNKTLAACLASLVFAATVAPSFAAGPQPIPLWPGAAPGEKGDIGEEKDMTKPKDGKPTGKSVIRLGNVSKPTITVFRPQGKQTGAAVVVCPGGGYSILAYDLEGTEVCKWLNSIGVTGVLLKYRVPARKDRLRHEAPLQDAQRALGIVRHRAKEWGIKPDRIGILGFSAGGHLTACASTNFDKRTYEPVDDADKESCRPDFAMPIYPAYLIQKDKTELSPELRVTAQTPPTFLVMTEDDKIRVECPIFYFLALKNAGVPAEMHLYPVGGHGYGLRPSDKLVTTWPKRAEEWMRSLGVLTKKK